MIAQGLWQVNENPRLHHSQTRAQVRREMKIDTEKIEDDL
jgi:hypothetical protein